jgi:hypothetical protein
MYGVGECPAVLDYGRADLRAFAVFFFLYPSLLHFQRTMKARRRSGNMEKWDGRYHNNFGLCTSL